MARSPNAELRQRAADAGHLRKWDIDPGRPVPNHWHEHGPHLFESWVERKARRAREAAVSGVAAPAPAAPQVSARDLAIIAAVGRGATYAEAARQVACSRGAPSPAS